MLNIIAFFTQNKAIYEYITPVFEKTAILFAEITENEDNDIEPGSCILR
jgi:hypothetical protein